MSACSHGPFGEMGAHVPTYLRSLLLGCDGGATQLLHIFCCERGATPLPPLLPFLLML